MTSAKTRILIAGGSFGGINAAYALRRRLGDRADLTLVSRDPAFTFTPSLPWLLLGWRQPASLQVALEQPLARRGIRFVHRELRDLDPAACVAHTEAGSFSYDYLVLATGAELDYAAVPGLGPAGGYTQCTFTVEAATTARDALARVLAADGGRIVIGAAPGASCLGPAYEVAMLVDTVLKRAGKRHRFRLSFVTPEPFLGHFGVGGLGMASRMFADEFAERDIEVHLNARISEAKPGALLLADGQELPFDFSLVIPAFLGSPFVRETPGLANPRGFIPVTAHLATQKYSNIYAAGVAVAIAPPGPTPVPVAVPKTGHMTELMAQIAAHNLAADLLGLGKVDGLSLPATCIADAGDTAFYLSGDPFLPPRNKLVHRRGKWARWLKLAFETYYLARIRHDLPSQHFGW